MGVKGKISKIELSTELRQKIDEIDNIGDVNDSSLPEELRNKTLTEMIKTNFTDVSNGKTKVANAITGKGISTLATDSFNIIANNISKIKTGYTSGDIIPMDKFEYAYKEGNTFKYEIEPLSKFDGLSYNGDSWSDFHIDQNKNMYVENYYNSKYNVAFYNSSTGKKKDICSEYGDRFRHYFTHDIYDDTILYEAYMEKYISDSVTLIIYKNTDKISSTTFKVPSNYMPNNDNSFSACDGIYNDKYNVYISTVYKYNSFGWKYRHICVNKSDKTLSRNYRSDDRSKIAIGEGLYSIYENDLYEIEKEDDMLVNNLKYENIDSVLISGTKYQLGSDNIAIRYKENFYIYDVNKNIVSKVIEGNISTFQRITDYKFLVIRGNKLEEYIVNNNTSVSLISQTIINYEGAVKLISKDGNLIVTYNSPNLYFYDKEKVISGIKIK